MNTEKKWKMFINKRFYPKQMLSRIGCIWSSYKDSFIINSNQLVYQVDRPSRQHYSFPNTKPCHDLTKARMVVWMEKDRCLMISLAQISSHIHFDFQVQSSSTIIILFSCPSRLLVVSKLSKTYFPCLLSPI
jgi:hypothetical protein